MPLKKYLRTFEDLLKTWNGSWDGTDMKDHPMTFVIGGIWALKLHGLVTRDSNDLDIIVYRPTNDFLHFLQSQKGIESRRGSQLESPIGEQWRSWKLTKDGLTIDFIMEHEEDVPENLLSYHFKDTAYQVQSIEMVIEKKKIYNREKDHTDFENFKQDNF